MKRTLTIIFLTGAILLTAKEVRASDPATKFGRGLGNTAFGWFEVVNEVGNESDRRGLLMGVPTGIVRGAVLSIFRTTVGVYELATFPVPNGSRGYEPVILPESVFKRR